MNFADRTLGERASTSASRPTRFGTPPSPPRSMPDAACVTCRTSPVMPTRARPAATTAPAVPSTATPPTSSRPTSPARPEPGDLADLHGCRDKHAAAVIAGGARRLVGRSKLVQPQMLVGARSIAGLAPPLHHPAAGRSAGTETVRRPAPQAGLLRPQDRPTAPRPPHRRNPQTRRHRGRGPRAGHLDPARHDRTPQ
jgi:hypothetical protein